MYAHLIPLALVVFVAAPATIMVAAVATATTFAARAGIDPVAPWLRAHRILPRRWRAGLVDDDWEQLTRILTDENAYVTSRSWGQQTPERTPSRPPREHDEIDNPWHREETAHRKLVRLIVTAVSVTLLFTVAIPAFVGNYASGDDAEAALYALAPSVKITDTPSPSNASGIVPNAALPSIYTRLHSAGGTVTCGGETVTDPLASNAISGSATCAAQLPSFRVYSEQLDGQQARINLIYDYNNARATP